MNLDFAGLRLLVTGGASGIGHAVATAALERGGQVAVLDLEPSTAPNGAIGHRADVADDESVAVAVAAAERLAAATGGWADLVSEASAM